MYKCLYSALVAAASAKNDLFLYDTTRQETSELTAISVNTVAPCQYVTESAFYNLAGIQNNNLSSKQQIVKRDIQPDLNITFNFCEDNLPTTDQCTD